MPPGRSRLDQRAQLGGRTQRREPVGERGALERKGGGAVIRARLLQDHDDIDERAVAQRIMNDMGVGQQPKAGFSRAQRLGREPRRNERAPGGDAGVTRRVAFLGHKICAH